MFQFPGFAFVTLCIQVRIPSVDICKSKTDAPFRARRIAKACAALLSNASGRPEDFKFTDIEGGFPHSEILGSKLVRSSPRHIAAYHVLHRLLAPRHPPDTLIALDCSHYRCPPTQNPSAEALAGCSFEEAAGHDISKTILASNISGNGAVKPIHGW